MSPECIEQQVREVAHHLFKVPLAQVRTGSQLVYDLGADSSDLLELSLQLSEHFGCDLDTERLGHVQTLGDYCTIIHHALVARDARV